MSDDVEALGGLATAGAVAHVIDPARGHAGEAHGACLNCGAALDGRFCKECGQPAHVHRTMGHIVEEFAHGILHVDTKAWRTLPLLILNPGRLTREYIHGKRARYIAPLGLFLFTVFLMFFVFGITGGPDIGSEAFTSNRAEEVASAREELTKARQEQREAATALARAKANPNPDPGDVGSAEGDVAAANTAVTVAEVALQRAQAAPADAPAARKSDGTWQDNLRVAAETGELKINFGNRELDQRARKALLNPDLTLYKLQQKAYKLSFLLVPLSLPFLWLLFPFRRDVTLFDHTVFALYSLSFMSLLFVVAVLLDRAGTWGAQAAPFLFLVPPIHMFAQLKGAYSLRVPGALWRTWWLLVFSTVVLAIYVTLIVFLGLVD